MPRLRRVQPDQPGWTRQRRGRGFSYLDEDGRPLGEDDAARCKALVIPPAWTDVWICPVANGHLQAVGTDDAGRRQYLYHPVWREQRDRAKHERVLEVARRLPQARRTVGRHLALPGMPRQRALATAFRLLDHGLFRVGGEHYAEDNGSFGLATIQKRHVRVERDRVVFSYPAKSGLERHVVVADPDVREAVRTMRSRRGGGPDLLAYKDGRRWRDIRSSDINEYLHEVIGGEVSAKDFRTWHGTVVAALALAQRADDATSTPPVRRRAVKAAMSDVAEVLGNTPAVARRSYVDARVIDAFEAGETVTVPARRPRTAAGRNAVEQAVHELLTE